jgi:nickel-dependent lactate racemase
MKYFAAVIGRDFIHNVALNQSGGLVGAVAGHYITINRAGVQILRAVYGVPIPGLADLTISSTSPGDFDLAGDHERLLVLVRFERPVPNALHH